MSNPIKPPTRLSFHLRIVKGLLLYTWIAVDASLSDPISIPTKAGSLSMNFSSSWNEDESGAIHNANDSLGAVCQNV